MKIQSINPYNNELNAEFDTLTNEELESKIQLAQESFCEWKNVSNLEKKELFLKLASILLENKEELAKLNVIEMWMTYKNALSDISKSSAGIEWFANNFEEILQDRKITEGGLDGKIIYEPLWVLYSVAPWNFPFNQVFRNAIPNILAWNTVLNKHASNVPMVAQKIEELFLEAGFSKWVFQNLFITPDMSEYIISHGLVRGTNITGWETAGRSIWSFAWENLKPSLLELGGSDPFLVLENNNLDRIIGDAVKARLWNSGQKCNSAKRFIVLEKYYDEFCEKFSKQMSEQKVWDPMDESTVVGPLAKQSLVDEIEWQVQDSIDAWSRLLTGWKRWEGNLFPPTVLSDVTPGMRVFDEEVFGPVAPVVKAQDINHAIELANMSQFGLGCSLYGDDIDSLKSIVSKIEAWNVCINKIVTSYPFLPYGWIKHSWYGKELWENGLKAFVNEKVVIY